jgi:hypothetical protein
LTPGNAKAFIGVDPQDAGVRVRAAFDLAVEHAGDRPVGPEIGAAGYLLDPIRAYRPGADNLQLFLVANGCHQGLSEQPRNAICGELTSEISMRI